MNKLTPSMTVTNSSTEMDSPDKNSQRPDGVGDAVIALSNSHEARAPGSRKIERLLKKLRSPKGVSLAAMMEATGWQAHSVRGFLSGILRKKLGHNLVSEVGKDGVRRYRVSAAKREG
jgi:Protein of unknown function (DUF3489)